MGQGAEAGRSGADVSDCGLAVTASDSCRDSAVDGPTLKRREEQRIPLWSPSNV